MRPWLSAAPTVNAGRARCQWPAGPSTPPHTRDKTRRDVCRSEHIPAYLWECGGQRCFCLERNIQRAFEMHEWGDATQPTAGRRVVHRLSRRTEEATTRFPHCRLHGPAKSGLVSGSPARNWPGRRHWKHRSFASNGHAVRLRTPRDGQCGRCRRLCVFRPHGPCILWNNSCVAAQCEGRSPATVRFCLADTSGGVLGARNQMCCPEAIILPPSAECPP